MKRIKRGGASLVRKRIKAIKLSEDGVNIAEIARVLKADRDTVTRWIRIFKGDGIRPLLVPRRPKKTRITHAQLERVVKIIQTKGAREFGERNNNWSYQKVARLIYQLFGITYDSDGVWRLFVRKGLTLPKQSRDNDLEPILRSMIKFKPSKFDINSEVWTRKNVIEVVNWIYLNKYGDREILNWLWKKGWSFKTQSVSSRCR